MLDADALGCLARLRRVVVRRCRDGRSRSVGPTLRIEAVGAAHEQVRRSGDCQNSDVILTLILNEEKTILIR